MIFEYVVLDIAWCFFDIASAPSVGFAPSFSLPHVSVLVASSSEAPGFELLASTAPAHASADELADFERLRKEWAGKSVRDVSSYVELLLIPTAFTGRNFVSEKLAATEAIQELPAAFRRPLHPDNFAALVTMFPEAKVAFRSPKGRC